MRAAPHAIRRNGWLTAAGGLLLFHGVFGIGYLILRASWLYTEAWLLIPIAFGLANVAAGIGVLHRRAWGRILAAATSGVLLLWSYAPAFAGALMSGSLLDYDWFGLVSYLLVLFAVLRRWRALPAPTASGSRSSSRSSGRKTTRASRRPSTARDPRNVPPDPRANTS